MQLTGNTILVTGGTSGIGLALAERFARKDNQVIIAGRRQDRLDAIAEKNPRIVGMRLDAADERATDAFAAEVAERFPALNVLVNNAGISRSEDLAGKGDLALVKETLATNVFGVLQLTARLLPTLKRQPRATLMTTTSGLAFVPLASHPTYSASKAFLHSWMESLRWQLRKTSIEVLELAPPYVRTELGGPRQASDPNAMPLDAFADEVMALLGKEVPRGEILVERVAGLRWAERDAKYEVVFGGMNPRE